MSDLKDRLAEAAATGLDMSPGDKLCGEALARITELEAALERAAGVIHGLNANLQSATNGEETLAREVLARTS